jgi:peptidoglycan/LPS O-acetylase OafA/YrhL
VTSQLAYRPDIDGLRGLAVLLVVAYHAFPDFRTGGFVGVDVFFVISGYLITQIVLGSLQTRTFSLAEFYRRRVRRIVPALLAVMTTCCIVAWFLLLPGELQWFGRSLAWCASFLANIFFARAGGYFLRAAESFPLLHLWSLGVEEQFYFAWPVLLLVAAKYGVTVRVLAIVIVTSLAISIWGAWYSPTPYFFYPTSRGWELAVGGLLAAWQSDARRKAPSDVLWSGGRQLGSLAGITLIVAGGVFWTADKAIPGLWSALPTAGAALLIAADGRALVSRCLLCNRPMIFTGKISYPLYLWHWPLFSFTHIVLGHPPPVALAAAECVIAFAAAYATYRWIEAPIRYGRAGRNAVPALLAGLVCLLLIGIGATKGWMPGRLSGPAVMAWDAAVRDWRFPSESEFGQGSKFGFATLSSRGAGKAVFIGDSHLQQYWSRMAQVIDSHGDSARSAVLVTRAGCPMLPGLNVRGRGHDCNNHFDFAMAQALKPDVDTVVFGAFWENYFLGEYSVKSPHPQLYRVDDESRKTLAVDSPGTEIAFQQFQEAIARLVSSGRRVFIVLSNPTSPLFIPRLRPAIRLSLQGSGSFTLGVGPVVDAEPFESYASSLMNRLRDIAARTGAKALDPRSTLCNGMICPASDSDGMPRYIDSSHLRNFAAREHASFIDETLLGRVGSVRSDAAVGSQLPLFKQ